MRPVAQVKVHVIEPDASKFSAAGGGCVASSGPRDRGMRVLGPQRLRGLSLPEVLIATVVLALASIAVTKSVATGHQVTHAALESERAMALIDAMMEEILAQDVVDPEAATTMGPDAGEATRLDWDNTDDFHGLIENAGALADRSGTLYPEAYQRFERSVTVEETTKTMGGFDQSITGWLVTVTVKACLADGTPVEPVWSVSHYVPNPVAGGA